MRTCGKFEGDWVDQKIKTTQVNKLLATIENIYVYLSKSDSLVGVTVPNPFNDPLTLCTIRLDCFSRVYITSLYPS